MVVQQGMGKEGITWCNKCGCRSSNSLCFRSPSRPPHTTQQPHQYQPSWGTSARIAPGHMPTQPGALAEGSRGLMCECRCGNTVCVWMLRQTLDSPCGCDSASISVLDAVMHLQALAARVQGQADWHNRHACGCSVARHWL